MKICYHSLDENCMENSLNVTLHGRSITLAVPTFDNVDNRPEILLGRRLACHPALAFRKHDEEGNNSPLDDAQWGAVIQNYKQPRQWFSSERLRRAVGVIEEYIERNARESDETPRRILMFSPWLKLLDLMELQLHNSGLSGNNIFQINGKVDQGERGDIINKFSQSTNGSVLLATTKSWERNSVSRLSTSWSFWPQAGLQKTKGKRWVAPTV